MLGGVVGEPAEHDLLLGAGEFPGSAGRRTHRKAGDSQRAENSDPTGDGPAMDAEDVRNVLDRVSVEYVLDGKEPSALQFGSRARRPHANQSSNPDKRVAFFF